MNPKSDSAPSQNSDAVPPIAPEEFVVKISDVLLPEKLNQVEVLFKGYTRAALGGALEEGLRGEAKVSAAYWRRVAALLAQRKDQLQYAYATKPRQVETELR